MKVLSFQEAIAASVSFTKRHLLLGNGFSIACRPDIFRYEKLLEQANFSTLSPSARQAFDRLGTHDFERVIKALRDAAQIADLYKGPKLQVSAMQRDADALKELLVKTIADSHPAYPGEILDAEYAACESFLSHFGTVYTLNYDLLLYWSLMHRESPSKVQSDDGFRTAHDDYEYGFESDYVVWEPGQSHGQNTWFLHGALHVFDGGTEIRKYTWSRTGVRLIDQVRDALDRDLFPLFVAEGTSAEKYERIRHSDYLAKAYRSFQEIQGCLFVYGHSLATNDEHYLRLIENGKTSQLYVGLYGDPGTKENRKIINRAKAMESKKGRRRSLKVEFYDSASACVWG